MQASHAGKNSRSRRMKSNNGKKLYGGERAEGVCSPFADMCPLTPRLRSALEKLPKRPQISLRIVGQQIESRVHKQPRTTARPCPTGRLKRANSPRVQETEHERATLAADARA
jgi:hypothetical protein